MEKRSHQRDHQRLRKPFNAVIIFVGMCAPVAPMLSCY
jgi:hypothetical protein